MKRAQRLVAATTGLALLLGGAGCATPYNFSPRLDTRLRQADGSLPANTELAGGLHLAQAALMDQRRLLWEDAALTERMKNATALGLIGLASAAAYRGLQGESSRGWLTRAGLLASATYLGADHLQPSARQRINLAGAMSLTCLALTSAAYEMPIKDYTTIRDEVAKARSGLEQLASAVRLLGRYEHHSDTWWLVRGGWNKLRWAGKVLDSADAALGNIEQSGPRLLNLTSALTSEVALQISRVTKDLSDIPDAVAKLKPNANLLLGVEVFAPDPKDAVDEDAPKGGAPSPNDAAKPATTTDKQCGAPAKPAPAPEPAGAASAAAKAASAAEDAAKRAARSADSAASSAAKAAKAAQGIAAAASAAKTEKQREDEQEAALRKTLAEVTKKLDEHLGPVISFVQRVAAARKAAMDLPPACGPGGVDLVPSQRSIVLRPNESFQYLLQGDSGRAGVSILGTSLPRDVLDLSMPLTQASTAVRLQAGARVPEVVNTVVRISDSKGQQTFDITVKICSSGG